MSASLVQSTCEDENPSVSVSVSCEDFSQGGTLDEQIFGDTY